MQLSVIILNYNVRYFLELCVLSVQTALTNIESEIIVIDNNSDDGSCEMIKALFSDVKLIQNKENVGFSKGNNIGVKQAKGRYICILNPDTVVAEDTFVKILAFAQRQKNLGIVGCRFIDGSGNFLPECKRGVPTPWVAFTKIAGLYKVFPRSRIFGKYYAQQVSKNENGKVDVLVGAFMLMKRELYQELEGFDEDCFMYSDDIDLSYRALKKGCFNYYFHETTIIHYKGESTLKDEIYMKRFQEAMQFFYKKHFKVAPLFTLFMNIGSYFFSFAKRIQGHSIIKKVPKSYLVYSSDEEFANKLTLILQKKVVFHNLKTEKMVISSCYRSAKAIEIILDNEFISFKECIAIIESSKNKELTFKIRPKKANFLIGSNNSNERGEIIKIE
tara:strand:+ start:14128 stop:15291 length:1164 start_codon:yes stop_codon:yes gene_type:complete